MLNRKMISAFFTFKLSSQPLNQTRRCLRFMRLERRFMLSGDFGDSFEVDDDDFDELDEIELGDFRFGDEYEYEEDYDGDSSDDHDDDDFEYQVNLISPQPIDLLVTSFSQSRDDSKTTDSSTDDVQRDLESELDTELGDDRTTEESSSTIENTSEGESIDLVVNRLSGLLQTSKSAVTQLTPIVDAPVARQQGSNQVNDQRDHTHANPSHQQLDSLYIPESHRAESHTQLIPLHSQPSEVVTQRSDEFEVAEPVVVAHHMPEISTPQQEETLGSQAIEWLGSFADELSALDEALAQLVGSENETWSLAHLFQHGPIVATGLITTGVASTVIQRKRRQPSAIEDNHYCVRFDVRQYPEALD